MISSKEEKFLIAPSILAANQACLGKEVQEVLKAGSDMIHIDVMDNHFVPNLSFGPAVCRDLRNFGIKAFFDVHLMTSTINNLSQSFIEAGANRIIFHIESIIPVNRTIDYIKNFGAQVGIAINPSTPLNKLEFIMHHLDIILLMSVEPGFTGQKFIPQTLLKIEKLESMLKKANLKIPIGVDGGINLDNISSIARAGANIFILGDTIFKEKNYNSILINLHEKLKSLKTR